MAAYRWVYDSRHLQADSQEPGSAPEPYARNRARATFTFLSMPAGFRRHLVGKTLINICHCGII